MAHNETLIKAPPEIVFAVLADPHAYSDWVVGAKRIRCYDPGWPAVGTSFHHSVGVGPLATRDQTTSVTVDPPRRIVLHARAMPAGVVEVDIELHPHAGGTRAVMDEWPLAGPGKKLYNPVFDALIKIRNAVSLRRLRVIAENRAAHDA